jgi:hypothetical protein
LKAGTKAESRVKGKPAKADEGREMPVVVFPCVCEHALQEKDGVVSLIRIVDTFHLELPPGIDQESGQAVLPPSRLELMVAVGLKAGGVRGRHEVGLVTYRPSGKRREVKGSLAVGVRR